MSGCCPACGHGFARVDTAQLALVCERCGHTEFACRRCGAIRCCCGSDEPPPREGFFMAMLPAAPAQPAPITGAPWRGRLVLAAIPLCMFAGCLCGTASVLLQRPFDWERTLVGALWGVGCVVGAVRLIRWVRS